jgi:hypothetical protein
MEDVANESERVHLAVSVSETIVRKLQHDLEQLKNHEIQFWQFLFGQMPNCRDIEPTPTSWCGGVTAGIKSVHRTLLLVIGLLFLSKGAEHADKVVSLLKWLGF